MLAMPDPDTAFIDPFMAEPTLSLTCTIAETGTREPYSRDPRGIAQKAEAYLKSTGIADTAFIWLCAECGADAIDLAAGPHWLGFAGADKFAHRKLGDRAGFIADEPDHVPDHRPGPGSRLRHHRMAEGPERERRQPEGCDAERDGDDQDAQQEAQDEVAEREPESRKDKPQDVQDDPHPPVLPPYFRRRKGRRAAAAIRSSRRLSAAASSRRSDTGSFSAHPSTSGGGNMSCASCHDPQYAYGPPNSLAVQLGSDPAQVGVRAVPSLRYKESTPAYDDNAPAQTLTYSASGQGIYRFVRTAK